MSHFMHNYITHKHAQARKARRKMQVFYTNINNEKPPRITSSDPKFRRISF